MWKDVLSASISPKSEHRNVRNNNLAKHADSKPRWTTTKNGILSSPDYEPVKHTNWNNEASLPKHIIRIK